MKSKLDGYVMRHVTYWVHLVYQRLQVSAYVHTEVLQVATLHARTC
jgi:hypothetical protein